MTIDKWRKNLQKYKGAQSKKKTLYMQAGVLIIRLVLKMTTLLVKN